MKTGTPALLILLMIAGFAFGAENGDAAFQRGVQYYLDKKFLLAIGSLKTAVDSGVRDPKAYFYLGNAYVNNEEYEKALESFRFALEASDKAELKSMINHNIGYVYYLKKLYPKSIDYFTTAYTINTNLFQTYWFKGMAYYKLRDKTNTISEWETYVTLLPDGRQSDNIRRALDILRSADFDFDKVNLFPDSSSSSSKAGMPNVDSLVDIEGVLNEVKPADKGKVVDEGLESIER